jgi:hypothetical protein
MEKLIEKYALSIANKANRDTFIQEIDVEDILKEYTEELNLHNEKQKVLNLPMIVDEYATLIHHLNKDTNYEDIDLLLQKMLYKVITEVDFRTLMWYRDWTTECLWYLGDKAQLDYYNNGWHTYRFGKDREILGQIPPKEDFYQIYHNNKIEEIYWNGRNFQHFDNYITHWKEISKPKDL